MRTEKPRTNGITIVLDKGLSIRQLEGLAETSGNHIDYVKLGWGTALVTDNLDEKLSAYKANGIPVFFGGTLFEYFWIRNELDEYRKYLAKHKLELMEISDGTVAMPHDDKLKNIKEFSQDFTVISEVGHKDIDTSMPAHLWVEYMSKELSSGASYVMAEARETGKGGICTSGGELRYSLIFEIFENVPSEQIIFEAPNREMQIWIIKKFGSNVNLANISSDDVIPLETIRRGLRSDTLLHFHQPKRL